MVAFVCNPFLAVLFKRTYDRYWKDEIGEMLINVNGMNDEAREFIVSLWKDDDKVSYIESIPAEIRQGDAFNRLFPMAKGKVLMTIDSDCFVYSKGIIKKNADLILSGKRDAVGSLGRHAHPSNVAKMISDKYGAIRLNPYLSFWRNSIARRIRNITFKTFTFMKGEKFEFLDQPMPANGFLDCMTKFCVQFFQQSRNIQTIETGELHKYVHISAISSIFRRCYRNLENSNKQEYEQTKHVIPLSYLGWTNLIYEATKNQVPLKKYKQEYYKGFQQEMVKRNTNLAAVKVQAKEYLEAHGELFK